MANDKDKKNHKMSAAEAGSKGGSAPHAKRGQHGKGEKKDQMKDKKKAD